MGTAPIYCHRPLPIKPIYVPARQMLRPRENTPRGSDPLTAAGIERLRANILQIPGVYYGEDIDTGLKTQLHRVETVMQAMGGVWTGKHEDCDRLIEQALTRTYEVLSNLDPKKIPVDVLNADMTTVERLLQEYKNMPPLTAEQIKALIKVPDEKRKAVLLLAQSRGCLEYFLNTVRPDQQKKWLDAIIACREMAPYVGGITPLAYLINLLHLSGKGVFGLRGGEYLTRIQGLDPRNREKPQGAQRNYFAQGTAMELAMFYYLATEPGGLPLYISEQIIGPSGSPVLDYDAWHFDQDLRTVWFYEVKMKLTIEGMTRFLFGFDYFKTNDRVCQLTPLMDPSAVRNEELRNVIRLVKERGGIVFRYLYRDRHQFQFGDMWEGLRTTGLTLRQVLNGLTRIELPEIKLEGRLLRPEKGDIRKMAEEALRKFSPLLDKVRIEAQFAEVEDIRNDRATK